MSVHDHEPGSDRSADRARDTSTSNGSAGKATSAPVLGAPVLLGVSVGGGADVETERISEGLREPIGGGNRDGHLCSRTAADHGPSLTGVVDMAARRAHGQQFGPVLADDVAVA